MNKISPEECRRGVITHFGGMLSLAALALVACGEAETDPERPVPRAVVGADSKGKPEAGSEAAKNTDISLPKLKCPVKVDPSLDGPDIIGVKLGMSKDSALMMLRCHTRDDGHLAFEKTWLPKLDSHQLELGPQAFSIMLGDTAPCSFKTFQDMQKCGAGNRIWNFVAEKITVAAPGLPGSETVVGIWRTQSFRQGEMPGVDDLKTSLIKKYGPVQWEDFRPHRRGNRSEMGWQLDLDGQPLDSGSPLLTRCGRNIASTIERGASWTEGCGLSIRAEIVHSAENPALARDLSVGMLHQDNLYAYGSAIQAELDQIEENRREAELKRMKTKAPGVKL